MRCFAWKVVVIRCFVKISSGHTAYGPYALQLRHWMQENIVRREKEVQKHAAVAKHF